MSALILAGSGEVAAQNQQPVVIPQTTLCAVQSLRSPLKKLEMKRTEYHSIKDIEDEFGPAFKSFDEGEYKVYVFADGPIFKGGNGNPSCGYVLLYKSTGGNISGPSAALTFTSLQQFDDYLRNNVKLSGLDTSPASAAPNPAGTAICHSGAMGSPQAYDPAAYQCFNGTVLISQSLARSMATCPAGSKGDGGLYNPKRARCDDGAIVTPGAQ